MARNQKVDGQRVLDRVMAGGANIYLERGEALALLDRLLGPGTDGDYERRKRLGTQMDRAASLRTSRARIPTLYRREDGTVRVGELRRWAERLLGQEFQELPRDPPSHTLYCTRDGFTVNDDVEADVYPGDVKRCHELIRALQERLAALTMELSYYEEKRKDDLVRRFRVRSGK